MVESLSHPRKWPLRLVAIALMCVATPSVPAQETGWMPTVDTHPWSRFGPRAWKQVRVTKSAFNEDGNLQRTSGTVTHTRVTRVFGNHFSLCVTAEVVAGGREFAPEPQTVTCDVAPGPSSSELVGTEQLRINGRDFRTQVIRLTTTDVTTRRISTLHHCADTCPSILKQHIKIEDVKTGTVLSETTMTVTHLDKPVDVLGEEKGAWFVTTVLTRKDGTVTTQEVMCHDVPGEMVSQVTEERDAKGRLLLRTELELEGYGYGLMRRLFRRLR